MKPSSRAELATLQCKKQGRGHGMRPPRKPRALFKAIPTGTVVGLRDWALIGVLIYSFARISAALSMRVEDYFPQGKRWWLRLHEKGGKNHEMPAHHSLEAYLDEYVGAAGIAEDKKGPLFRAALTKNGGLSARPMIRRRALEMIARRAQAAGIKTRIGCHTFRATGDHDLPDQRRHAREGADDGGALEPAHHQALRPHQRCRQPR
jgi:integrase